jgi:hypothetical protein
MRDPHSGGAKISPQQQRTVEQRIKAYAEPALSGLVFALFFENNKVVKSA